MKIELTEHEGCFHFEIEAENMQDAATLVRFGMNSVKEVRSKYACATADGAFHGSIVFGKSKRADSAIPKR